MPLLSQLFYAVIIPYLLTVSPQCPWYRHPPPIPPLVHVYACFVTEWNAGLYPYRRHIHKPPWCNSSAIDTFPPHSTSAMTTADQVPHIDTSHMPLIDVNLVSLDHGNPEQHRSVTENAQLQAYLYSLSTPGANHKIRFGTDAEDICIDTGASACISRL
jgi:hypothetical protein